MSDPTFSATFDQDSTQVIDLLIRQRDAARSELDRANREIRRLLAERAAAVMERDRARADLDDRLVEHLRTDAEHRAEIDRPREQVAQMKGGA